MSHSTAGRLANQVALLRRQFAQCDGSADGLPFGRILSAELVHRVIAAAGLVGIDTIYTPLTTLLLFLWQVTSPDQSCRAAVAKLVAHRTACGERPCSSQTGAYCLARRRIPESVYADLVRQTAAGLESQAPPQWRWKGRHVKVFDGSTVSMPDTLANQREYPQQRPQAPGVGFPRARIAAVFSLMTAAVLDLGICRCQGKGQSELGLLRLLRHDFQPGEVMLADRYACSWCELALLRQRGVDFVARLHQRRKADFRRGKRLGRHDHLVTWKKPRRPDWLDKATFEALPKELTVRESRISVAVAGFRSRTIVVATSLVDAQADAAAELAELYRARWHAEVDLRSLKATLQMDVLRCKTPEMVRAEIWVHLLAYNLVRTTMAQAAWHCGRQPRQLSFTATLQLLLAFQPYLALMEGLVLVDWHRILLGAIAEHPVGNRPDRYEPRKRKRRPKPYGLLTTSRAEARRKLI